MNIDPFEYPYCASGDEYARQIVAREIPSCKYVLGACERYFRDLENPKYKLDLDIAERYLRLVQQFKHVKGEWDTEEVTYEPWQNFIFMNIMGFQDLETGYRRFRIAHLEIGRGNGKSCFSSQAALYFLALDDPKGNEISCFATKSDQAKIVLDSARAMAERSAAYRAKTGVQVFAHSVVHKKSNSKILSRSADSKSMDGLNDVLSILDELHAMDRKLFDVISSGMSKRKDSLMLCITTAGFSNESIGYTQSIYAKKVALGEVSDEQMFSIIYTIDEGDDIYSEETWKKANPNWNVSVDPVTFEAKAKKTKESPSDLPNFKVKHLNMWVSEAEAFYSQEKWDACADPTLTFEKMRGKKCYVGIDIASKVDLTSLSFVFWDAGKYHVLEKSYIPERTFKDARSHIYDQAVIEGHLIVIPGEAVNYDILLADLVSISKIVRFLDIHYDPWNASSFAQDLQKERFNITEFRLNTANMSEPTKTLDALMRQGKIVHNGSPLLRWCLGNVICKEDAAGNVFPRKSHEKFKIDPVIAILYALAGWIQNEPKESVYESRGIINW